MVAIQFALAALILLFATGGRAGTTNDLSTAEIQGRQLAQQLCNASPEENFNQSGVLITRDSKGNKANIPVSFKTQVTAENWKVVYYEGTNCWIIIHQDNEKNRYVLAKTNADINAWSSLGVLRLNGNETMIPFAGSDFWIADLGLEFLHWPDQKILPKTTNLKRGRSYTLLESTNPNPSTNGYSRVLSWIDKETDGILEAEAYDSQGKLLKDFEPKSFKKVNGQWELQEMEIRNVQTGSSTKLEFDLKK